MTRSRRDIQGKIEIDGVPLLWNLHREQQMSTEDGLRGICIHVRVAEGTFRELYIEYPVIAPIRSTQLIEAPVRPTILKAKVEESIRQAVDFGFKVKSRGKPFIFFPDDLPC